VSALGLTLALALTLPPLSSTRIQTWPWSFYAAVFWLLPILVAVTRLALGRPDARLGGALDAVFATLAFSGLAATALSPLRATLAPQLLPFLGALALPYALLPLLRDPRRADLLASLFLYPLLFVCAFLWSTQLPSLAGPYPRNAEPFGHSNTTGAVLALAACWLATLAVRAQTLPARLLHAVGAAVAVALAASSSSRGAVLALALAGIYAAGAVLLRRGRVITFLAIAVASLAVALVTNPRLREFAFGGGWSDVSIESNAQRMAMFRGGFALAAERPATGWGPGAVPHVFPRVRAEFPGEPDNYLQLHNSFAQTAATLGGLGLLALALLAYALATRTLRQPHSPEKTPLTATLLCGAVVLLFDHSFATPAFALLAALPVAALGAPAFSRHRPGSNVTSTSPASVATQASRPRAWLLLLPLVLIAWPVSRDLAARAAWSEALDAAAADEPEPYLAALRRAHALRPADPFFSDQLASHLATGHPFGGLAAPDPDGAVPLHLATLARNPAHEAAHYNLGWLLLDHDPFAARDHFASALALAPSRAQSYLGLALARIFSGDRASPAPELAAEILLDPAFAWSPHWRALPLAPHRAETLRFLADHLAARGEYPIFAAWLRNAGPPAEPVAAYRRVRTGHGVLYGHPEGPPPADATILLQFDLPAGLRAALPPRRFLDPAAFLATVERPAPPEPEPMPDNAGPEPLFAPLAPE
jgi:O-antigen ligase